MKTNKIDQNPDDRKTCNTYIKFVFENLEEVQTKLHRLVELEKETRALMQELNSEKLILTWEIECRGTSGEDHNIDEIAEKFSQKMQETAQQIEVRN